MSQGDILNLAQQAIYTGIMISAPMLGAGLVIGIIISIFQAATQINEQTLVFIPKIIAIALTMLLFGPWILSTMINFTTKLFNNINIMVH